MADRRRLSVLIAIPTCRRPRSLDGLLASLMAQETPPDCDLGVLVVENDPARGGLEVATRYSDRRAEMPVSTCIEESRGIPHARNRALDEARVAGADLLLFMDDDEVADPDWLARLVEHCRTAQADLAGGPVYAIHSERPLTRLQDYLFRGVERWYEVRQIRNARRASRGRIPVILTNNWALDMAFQRRTGLRFDERFRITGGSDANFHACALAAGARVTWCHEARVREIIDPERLRPAYIFDRARQQAISHFERRNGYARLSPTLNQLLAAPLFAILGVARIATAPVAGPYAMVDGLRLLGRATGKVMSVFGASSKLYKLGTGSDPLG